MTATQQRTAMQQPVHARESTAPLLDQAAPWQPTISPEYRAAPAGSQSAPDRSRTPLAIVPAPVRRSGRGFVALCVGILAVALLAVLVVNISVSNRQYQMVGLKSEQLDLTQANERLRQQVEHLEAPQNLAAEADRLGMVRPGDIAAIDLATGEVSGAATSAEGEDRPAGLIEAPVGPAEQAAARAAEGQATENAAEQAPAVQESNGTTAPGRPAGEQPADHTAAGQEDQSAGSAEGRTGDDGSGADRELNGGTIPAPQFTASSTD
ncbi:MAG: hypothetical protein QJR09_13815 [Micrococcus sp.]|nr:hypothetical protein [Micrococcus sp.]